MLRECLAKNADVFITVDSDTYLNPDADILKESITQIIGAATAMVERPEWNDVYAVTAPVRQKDGHWNVVYENKRFEELPDGPFTLPGDGNSWTAFAFAIHRVHSYREWADESLPFYNFSYHKDRPEGDKWVGEDSYHSLLISKRQGKIIVNPLIKTGHDV
jgi:hypothetical protein